MSKGGVSDVTEELFELPDGWKWAKLSDVAEIGSTQIQPKRLGEERVQYVALENVERGTGQLINYSPMPADEIASNKYTFTPEHVLYGKLRPYLQKALLPGLRYIGLNYIDSATCISMVLPESVLTRRALNRWQAWAASC